MNRILFVFRNGISKYFHVFYLKTCRCRQKIVPLQRFYQKNLPQYGIYIS